MTARPRLRFSLRTLFVVMILVLSGSAVGGCSYTTPPKGVQSHDIAKVIVRHQGKVDAAIDDREACRAVVAWFNATVLQAAEKVSWDPIPMVYSVEVIHDSGAVDEFEISNAGEVTGEPEVGEVPERFGLVNRSVVVKVRGNRYSTSTCPDALVRPRHGLEDALRHINAQRQGDP